MPSMDGTGEGSSRADHAYATVLASIHSGRFRPGERIREADVAESLGVSRTPVRDALKRLESEGLLASAPRRGLVVAQLDQQQVTEIYVVRCVLEGLAARLAAQHASNAETAAMRELLERQARTRSEDLLALARLNRLFHDVMYRAARNRYLISVLDSFESFLALLPGTTYVASGRPASALKEHSAIVGAIERRDADAAERLAREHIAAAERIRLLMISSGQDPRPARGSGSYGSGRASAGAARLPPTRRDKRNKK